MSDAREIGGLTKTVCNDVPVYNLSSGKTLPEFLEEARRKHKSLRYDEKFRNRLELIQDFGFQSCCNSIDISKDQNYVVASGVYAPEIRIFDMNELGLKCSRGIDSEVIATKFLSDDYKKIVLLRADRTLEFHAQYGRHHEIRIPNFGRDIDYDHATCILYVSTASDKIQRLDLEEGIFVPPLSAGLSGIDSINSLALAPCALPVVVAGGDGDRLIAWDTRDDSKPLSFLPLQDFLVTKVCWSPDALQIAIGSSEGVVKLFDIRSFREPIVEKAHRNESAIVGLDFHKGESSSLVLCSSDRRGVKLWDSNDNFRLITTVEAPLRRSVQACRFWPNSGLLFTPVDDSRIGIHFIPSVGPAPSWCGFLDSLTEELEQKEERGANDSTSQQHQSLFEDFVFVSQDQLEQLGGTSLIGSSLLKAYMHGYWIDQRLYKKLSAVSEPFVIEKFREKRLEEGVKQKRGMRVPLKNQKNRMSDIVNVDFKDQLRKRLEGREDVQVEQGKATRSNKKGGKDKEQKIARALLEDGRFSKLWSNPDFEVQEENVRKN